MVSKNVTSEGQIYFDRIKAFPKALNLYLDQLAAVSPDSHPQKFETYEDRLAYWMNAYHALQMKLIMEKYPIDAVTEINELRDRKSYYLGGQLYSANEVYARIKSEFFGFPQVWFALSDFTKQSPALLNRAYTGSNLKELLDGRARAFINDDSRVKLAWDNPPVEEEKPIDPEIERLLPPEENTICERVLTMPKSFQAALPSIENYTVLSESEPNVSALKGNVHLLTFLKEYFSIERQAQLTEACSVKIKYETMNPALNKYF